MVNFLFYLYIAWILKKRYFYLVNSKTDNNAILNVNIFSFLIINHTFKRLVFILRDLLVGIVSGSVLYLIWLYFSLSLY